jgi:hypothetical protein
VSSLGLKENGYLFLSSMPNAQRHWPRWRRCSAEGAATELWDPDQVKARFPWLNTAIWWPRTFGPRDEGWFDNMGLMAGFRNAARAQGARFLTARGDRPCDAGRPHHRGRHSKPATGRIRPAARRWSTPPAPARPK